MAKSSSGSKAKRKHFIETVLENGCKIDRLYERFGFSRSSAYVLWARYLAGGEAALAEQKRGPAQPGGSWQAWERVILALRRREPDWGPRKLRYALAQDFPRQPLPSPRTIARMLKAAGCVRRRRLAGPSVPRLELTQPRRSNEVWSIDFKGDFRTGDGARCRALTLRDLHSRYVLLVQHLPPSERAIRRALSRVFARCGLPQVLRVDNGKPFGGEGARGLTALSVWWTRLGIRVEFIRPGKPQDNGAHEQMHRVLKRRVANPPAPNLRAQAARFRAFQRWYNEQRMHQAHGEVPAKVYRPAPAPLPEIRPLEYPAGWSRKRVSGGGLIRWAGRPRMIGRPFRYQHIGLEELPQPKAPPGAAVRVYLGNLLLGELHASDPGSLRAIRYRRDRS
jgi:transposase InsO family protein